MLASTVNGYALVIDAFDGKLLAVRESRFDIFVRFVALISGISFYLVSWTASECTIVRTSGSFVFTRRCIGVVRLR